MTPSEIMLEQLIPGDFWTDDEVDDLAIIQAVRFYTMTSAERVRALIRAVRYVAAAGVSGSLVECGVWKGGSVMAMALTLLTLGRQDRALYLFDTFSGMTEPGEMDVDFEGRRATEIFEEIKCVAPLEEVREAVYGTGYDPTMIRFVEGAVEKTIPANAPESIALLRLDTDWFQSTSHELRHLFPRLNRGGVMIVDDYGHWQGARQAVDEYFAENNIHMTLRRIDYTGLIGIKS